MLLLSYSVQARSQAGDAHANEDDEIMSEELQLRHVATVLGTVFSLQTVGTLSIIGMNDPVLL